MEAGGALEVGDLFVAFKNNVSPLLVIGGLLLVATLVIGLVAGTLGFRKAEVTAGGVALSEVDSRDMQSKLVPGLYIAGELLDLDGPIGRPVVRHDNLPADTYT